MKEEEIWSGQAFQTAPGGDPWDPWGLVEIPGQTWRFPQARAMATRKSWWCALPWLVYVGLMETMPGKTVILKELGVIYDTYMMSIYTNQLVTSLFILFGPYENYHALKLVVSSSGLFLPSRNFRANGQWASYDHYCGWSRVLVTYFHNIFTRSYHIYHENSHSTSGSSSFLTIHKFF